MRLALLIVLTAVLAAPAGAATCGLKGVVMRGPITPVCQAENPCDAPAKHVVLTFSRNGVSRSVTTDDQGKYLIRLAPGTWSVRIPTGKFGYEPRAVNVRSGVMRTVDFSIDTGIR